MMLFCTFRVVGTQLEATYKWRMTGDGLFLSMGVPRNCPINGCRGGGGNFHLQGPNMWSILPPVAHMRMREVTIARATYLVGA